MRLAANRSESRAFTLVEILIVVIILGIIATIIIGLFANSSADASRNSLKDNLRSIRSALQIYVAQHASYPAAGTFEAQMTQYTDAAGNVSPTKTATHVYGPYILAMPTLPVGADRGATGVTTTTYSAGYGWGYDATTGTFKANCADTDLDSDGVAFNTY
jgi:general secretion pathway protein G